MLGAYSTDAIRTKEDRPRMLLTREWTPGRRCSAEVGSPPVIFCDKPRLSTNAHIVMFLGVRKCVPRTGWPRDKCVIAKGSVKLIATCPLFPENSQHSSFPRKSSNITEGGMMWLFFSKLHANLSDLEPEHSLRR